MRQNMSFFSGALISTLIAASFAASPAHAASSAPAATATPSTTSTTTTTAPTAAATTAPTTAPTQGPASSTTSSTSSVTNVAHVISTKKAGAKAKKKKKAKKRGLPLRRRALLKARSRTGAPYVYGGNGPRAFDCSGLTRWSYAKVGKYLPRTSSAQAGAVKRIRSPKRGDLVFFHNRGRVYHVGLYAGKNRVFHASRPGKPVGQERIWTSSVFFGRA